ncbi:MFS transporter [Pseudomonas gingeri]|uniref:MFS transporter n=1 Tax=Pseudomonas gingeri TaxID=117681 RepID=UPI0015A2FFD3|nr:MFS transporter [Pseudomonas gingeri]NWA17056.1 MFS transporter [Pseudomonas gingeri]NWA58507.1 MFS transporter [Pseudomonas gingeri]NWA97901.1 MFS transporter [Pseudomonas gingeri]NWB06015.1 MFS transporter [Pseudomonas gingeri]
MTRGQVKRRLAVGWYKQLVLSVLPLFVANWFFAQSESLLPVLAMPFFIAGVASMFISLRFFDAYKRSLIATQAVLDTPEEPAAWIALANVRSKALVVAALPTWIGTLAVFVGLEAVPLVLLVLSTVVLFYLYRIPRQLG